MRALFGIDIGTQGTKAGLFAEDGTCLAISFCPSRPRHPAPGAVEEDPEDQLASVIFTIRECLAKSALDPGQIAGLGIAGQMAGVIGIDAAGRAITPYDSWLDTRCGHYIAKMEQSAGAEICASTGSPPSFNHGPKILWWKHERPVDYARIVSFVQPGAYAAMRLCDLNAGHAFIDYTYLHFSGFADNTRFEWNDTLCSKFDVDPSKLPNIVPPFATVGTVCAVMAKATGLRTGTPVVAGCGDTAASFLASGAIEEGTCVDVAGTASVFAATCGEFSPDLKSRTLACGRSVIPELWHPYAYVNGGGQNLEWFSREIALQRYSLDELCTLAGDNTRDELLPYFIPHLGGRVSPPRPALRGSWAGLNWDNSLGTLFRSVLEGVALEYSVYAQAVHALVPGHTLREIRIVGGGEKSRAWNQLKSDRLQTRVVTVSRGGGAPMGAALVAGHGTGVFPDLASTCVKWVQVGETISPDVSQASLSTIRVRRYGALLEALQGWSAIN